LKIKLRTGNSYDPEVLIKELEKITFEDFLIFHREFLKTARFEWLIMGNLTKEIALGIVDRIDNIIKNHNSKMTIVLEKEDIV
jgi:secreted Zn-dependent insulinase-like peptidase